MKAAHFRALADLYADLSRKSLPDSEKEHLSHMAQSYRVLADNEDWLNGLIKRTD
jgi:hypothetical protein